MADYDKFAPYYDAAMGDRGDVVGLLSEIITQYNPSANSLLELGCGTGSILAGFDGKFSLTGLDNSANMLQIAQRKLPDAKLQHATIAGFELHQTYDVCICVFDTINHLASFDDWQKLFHSAKIHLRTNGLFIFDMDTVERLRMLSGVPGYRQDVQNGTLDIVVEAISSNEVQWHLTIQEPGADGAIQVFEEHVREASYPLAAVRAELEAQFEVLDSFDSNRHLPTEHSDRVYFVCRPLSISR